MPNRSTFPTLLLGLPGALVLAFFAGCSRGGEIRLSEESVALVEHFVTQTYAHGRALPPEDDVLRYVFCGDEASQAWFASVPVPVLDLTTPEARIEVGTATVFPGLFKDPANEDELCNPPVVAVSVSIFLDDFEISRPIIALTRDPDDGTAPAQVVIPQISEDIVSAEAAAARLAQAERVVELLAELRTAEPTLYDRLASTAELAASLDATLTWLRNRPLREGLLPPDENQLRLEALQMVFFQHDPAYRANSLAPVS